jgi:hypothetical protein
MLLGFKCIAGLEAAAVLGSLHEVYKPHRTRQAVLSDSKASKKAIRGLCRCQPQNPGTLELHVVPLACSNADVQLLCEDDMSNTPSAAKHP